MTTPRPRLCAKPECSGTDPCETCIVVQKRILIRAAMEFPNRLGTIANADAEGKPVVRGALYELGEGGELVPAHDPPTFGMCKEQLEALLGAMDKFREMALAPLREAALKQGVGPAAGVEAQPTAPGEAPAAAPEGDGPINITASQTIVTTPAPVQAAEVPKKKTTRKKKEKQSPKDKALAAAEVPVQEDVSPNHAHVNGVDAKEAVVSQ